MKKISLRGSCGVLQNTDSCKLEARCRRRTAAPSQRRLDADASRFSRVFTDSLTGFDTPETGEQSSAAV